MADPLVTVADAAGAGLRAGRRARRGREPSIRSCARATAPTRRPTARWRSPSSSGATHASVAADVVAAAAPALTGVAALEVAGPASSTSRSRDAFLAEQLAAVAADDRLGVPPPPTPETVVIDYSAPNVAKEMHVGHLRTHRHRRRARAACWSSSATTSSARTTSATGARPFGMLIEHLLDDRRDRRRRSARRSATSTSSTSGARQVRRRRRVQGARPRAGRLLQARDPETLRAVAAAGRRCRTRVLQPGLRAARRAADRRRPGGRERATNALLPAVLERLARRRAAAGERRRRGRVPARLHQPRGRAAAADRAASSAAGSTTPRAISPA